MVLKGEKGKCAPRPEGRRLGKQLRERDCYWDLLGRDQRHCLTSHNAEKKCHNKELLNPKC